MAFRNLPGVFPEKQDGGLTILASTSAPRVLVLGTASKGTADMLFTVGRSQEAASQFGSDGTLVRGMYESKTAGSTNTALLRINAKAASLEGIGVAAVTGGIKITTFKKDDDAGESYEFYWDDTEKRLVVRNVSSTDTVYDRDFNDVEATINSGEVIVSGAPGSGGIDIGTPSAFHTLKMSSAEETTYSVTYTDGVDGVNPSRMELYEALEKAYRLIENEQFDIIVPMDVYLDDKNLVDGDTITLPGVNEFPVAGSDSDALGKVFIDEYLGQIYFFWDTDSDGTAELWPAGIGSASATTKIDGSSLTAIDFHEVNFAYQLANFCFDISENNIEITGPIGVRPPASVALEDVALWIGELPVYSIDAATGIQSVASAGDNGNGLLGNKFMAGKYGYEVAGIAGNAGGGFIKTDSGFVDGIELKDRGGRYIDIGKHISVLGAWVTLFNPFDVTGFGYTASMAPSYAGMYSALQSKSAPTNKVIPGVALPFRINNSKLDDLAGLRYVMAADKAKGNVVSDAPTAARPDSDYARLTTVRIVKDVIDAVRQAAEPFIGEAGGAAQRAALKTAIDAKLGRLQQGQFIQRYDLNVTATPAQQIQGDAIIELNIVPAFELRQITLILSLLPQ
jgi:hypothetical protein